MVPDQGPAGGVSAGLRAQRRVGEAGQPDDLLAPGAAREPEGRGADEDLHHQPGLCGPGPHGRGEHPGRSSLWITRGLNDYWPIG